MENISKEIIRKKTVDKDILLRKESTFDKYINESEDDKL